MIFRGIISLFFILILGLIILIDTDIGLGLLIKAAPGTVKVEKISGNLLHGGTIKHFDYQYDDFSLSFDEFKFHWKWSALLKQNIVIDEVRAKNLEVSMPESRNSDSSINLPSIRLPLNIYLKKLLLEKIQVHTKEKSYLINRINLTGESVNNLITLHHLSVLTPDIFTSTEGKLNIATWDNINFKNTLVLNSRPEIPIVTRIIGDKNLLTVNIQSVKWLSANLRLHNYLRSIENTTLESKWFIDTTKAAFPELKKLNGKLQFSGQANGRLLQPLISGKLLAQNLQYESNSIKKLTSSFSFSLNEQQKIEFKLSGQNLFFGETLLNSIQASILGSVKSHKINFSLQMMDSYFFSVSTQAGFMDKTYYFKKGKFNIDPLNLDLYPVALNIHFDKNNSLNYDAKLQHTDEVLNFQGSTKLDFPRFETHASLSSNKFSLINTSAYKITINPDLFIDYQNDKTKIGGSLNVISANITPLDLSNTVTLTNDIVYVNNQNQPLYKKSEPLKLFMDIVVKIKKLAINYKGLNADISGETKLTQTPTTELNAYGQLQILKGAYKAYGQMLTIQKGSVLNFNREIDNPQLNITASKEIKVSPEYMILPSYQPYLIAGVQVTGTADEPTIHLFSIPSGVSQQDILSYLIFGFPQNQLSKSQASTLWSAFNMIDTGNSNFSIIGLQKSIQNEFGLSEFGLGSTSEYNAETQQYESGTSFVVSKRITDNLTASYNMGIVVPVNVLYLRYQVSQHWALQSDSSVYGNGGDILYTIRKD